MSLKLQQIDRSWTLFIDRDGVVNIEKEADYVYRWEEFHFYPDALGSLAYLSTRFGRILMVTNQRGVAKGLMSEEDLQDIHRQMLQAIALCGGRIDRIYTCTDLDERSPRRKPNPDMGLEARADFPEVDFEKSVMLGNRPSDMRFGRNLGMKTIYLRTTHPEQGADPELVDLAFDSLSALASALRLAEHGL